MLSPTTVCVTGGSGYIGGYCIAALLEQGHTVHTTIRNLAREAEVRESLAKISRRLDRLSFFAADLMSDAGWADAFAGCSHVLHVASPFPTNAPKHEDDLIVPAREGTLRALRFARDAGVRRVVVTSSIAAICYGQDNPNTTLFDESIWTDPSRGDVSAYVKSKTIAERAAWDWLAAEGGALEMATVNPSAVLGPLLGSDFSTSLEIVKKLMEGAFPGVPRLGFALVDVRDIADLHLLAMATPQAAGQRYIGGIDFFWMEDVARMLRDGLGLEARKVPKARLPGFLLRLVAKIDPAVASVVGELDRTRRVTHAKATQELGWNPRPVETTVLETARSMIREGVVKV
jgi:dihydroflavonol-4-reductase